MPSSPTGSAALARRPRPPRPSRRPAGGADPTPAPTPAGAGHLGPPGFWTKRRVALAVVVLLSVHLTLAVRSLVRENPTVDEVAHLPAGITYWQAGTFRLYHHNPPLIKLVAALPVVLAKPAMEALYHQPSWTDDPPSQA